MQALRQVSVTIVKSCSGDWEELLFCTQMQLLLILSQTCGDVGFSDLWNSKLENLSTNSNL